MPERASRLPAPAARAVLVALLAAGLTLAGCATERPPAKIAPPRAGSTPKRPPATDHEGIRQLEVTATAYNSVRRQTNSQPSVSAWGDVLEPGMKSIAVSRDLIDLGLGHGALVEIEGLQGVYVVRDKMAKRWRRKIDIYMGKDVEAAREWGNRRVRIRWTPPTDDPE